MYTEKEIIVELKAGITIINNSCEELLIHHSQGFPNDIDKIQYHTNKIVALVDTIAKKAVAKDK